MPRRQSAHSQVDQLRQRVAAERMKQREFEAQLGAAKADVEEASARITDGYAAEDEQAVAAGRKTEQAAVDKVRELAHRLAGAEIRAERAQQALATFERDHAADLLAEREQPARKIAAEFTASVHETLRLGRAYLAERAQQDALVAAVPGASPRTDGPPSAHPWESQLKALERAVSEAPECPAPLPRWRGLEHRQHENSKARRLQLQRRKKLNAAEQAELERLNRTQTPGHGMAVLNQ